MHSRVTTILMSVSAFRLSALPLMTFATHALASNKLAA